jgi:hypothetical protein
MNFKKSLKVLKLMLSGSISRIKVRYMSHDVFKRQVYAGLVEILKDKNLYYVSGIDGKYNKLTDAGQKAVIDYLTMMAPHIVDKEKQVLENLAKEMTWETLKK